MFTPNFRVFDRVPTVVHIGGNHFTVCDGSEHYDQCSHCKNFGKKLANQGQINEENH